MITAPPSLPANPKPIKCMDRPASRRLRRAVSL